MSLQKLRVEVNALIIQSRLPPAFAKITAISRPSKRLARFCRALLTWSLSAVDARYLADAKAGYCKLSCRSLTAQRVLPHVPTEELVRVVKYMLEA
jgi:hypothetical protein